MRCSLAAMSASALLLTVSWASAVLAAEVPLASSPSGHDTVPVYVNGKGPYPFILDTGADSSAVYQWFANEAGLLRVKGKDRDLSGQTGSAPVPTYRINNLTLAGLSIHAVDAFGLPNRVDAGNEAGVLGNDFMDKAVVSFDFPCRRVELYAKPIAMSGIVGRESKPLRAGIDPGSALLTVPVTVNGFLGVGVLDTGSRRTRLNQSFARGAGLDLARSFHDDAPIYGTSLTKLVPRTGPIGEVRVGDTMFADATGQVIDLPVLMQDFGGKPAMILGADLIGRYRLVYEHADRTIWFERSSCLAN